jgi:hypothetical protein
MLMDYNMVRFFFRVTKPPVHLSELINSSGINKHRVVELARKLPDLLADYDSRFTWFKENKKPREIVSFCIQTLCEFCLTIWNNPDKETEKLCHDFVDLEMKKILRSEELCTKAGHFNWSLLFGDKETKEEKERSNYDQNFVEASEIVDVEAEGDEDEDFGSTDKPLSTDSFDTEDADIDPTDEDPGNQINVEGYGF